MASSPSDVFAEPMIDSDDYLKEYVKQLRKLNAQGLLPDLKKTLKYKVYSIQGSGFGAHRSIVLTSDDEHFVTVELGFITVNEKKHIYPVTKAIDKSFVPKMKYLGEINTTGNQLIGKALAVMKRFGSYFKFRHNCQDFCNRYLEAIGLTEAKTLTTGDKVELTA